LMLADEFHVVDTPNITEQIIKHINDVHGDYVRV
jgi:hypothetical protein